MYYYHPPAYIREIVRWRHHITRHQLLIYVCWLICIELLFDTNIWCTPFLVIDRGIQNTHLLSIQYLDLLRDRDRLLEELERLLDFFLVDLDFDLDLEDLRDFFLFPYFLLLRLRLLDREELLLLLELELNKSCAWRKQIFRKNH